MVQITVKVLGSPVQGQRGEKWDFRRQGQRTQGEGKEKEAGRGRERERAGYQHCLPWMPAGVVPCAPLGGETLCPGGAVSTQRDGVFLILVEALYRPAVARCVSRAQGEVEGCPLHLSVPQLSPDMAAA